MSAVSSSAGILARIWELRCHVDKFVLHDYLGEITSEQPLPQPLWRTGEYDEHRAEMHHVICQRNTQEYYEDEASGKVWVRVDAKREVMCLEADPVTAADGMRSRAGKYILEQGIGTDPLTDYLTMAKDAFFGWIGRGLHFLASSAKGGKEISWVITRKNDWCFSSKMEDLHAIVNGWDPHCTATLARVSSCINWKLIIHHPLPTWVSKSARVVLIGDAAHSFLSYLRVRETQLIGEDVHNRWHHCQPGDRGPMLDVTRPEWPFAFDAEADVSEVFDGAARDIRENGYNRPVLPPEPAP
ncbi:hypothetical protein CONPUDRAFT_155599 [Coniophora puteana RWD-64-598 SS2]|uniref:FAD-binding domain-containing protein n=1 Tax=Coniophora puteana (strain RWD-64-598) TaxID=741705 RepID=A0A5M3MJB9_CONPW|nr:uncharacterized protein CONPUDRAFT_155599 [Coniophora puteana RWD-64-598 SS2]EIW78894.1 hypothetical protein CONPUDRAFT_155599 [Coniophora puteana RWD-64-598 SS2]